jgi:anion-transporting  ArsA/GET3 family ATPase
VIENPIFQIFAKEFSGTNEYMAMQRLYALDQLGKYDTIILDTPPSRNTLAFLNAPQLLSQFFEERFIRWLVLPANRLFTAGMRKGLSLLERLTGTGFMTSLFDFASALFEIRVEFAANLKKIISLLESKDVGFLIVTHPTPDTAPEIGHFIDTLREHHFHFDGVILNRTLSYLKITDAEWAQAELRPALKVIEALQKRESTALRSILKETSSPPYAMLPELARDVHSLEDLFHVARALDISHLGHSLARSRTER